jgi:hypothetical protein
VSRGAHTGRVRAAPCAYACAALLIVVLVLVLVLVLWTLPELEPKPVPEGLRNRRPATHSPGPSGTELCSGAGSDGGGRPDQDCFRSGAPEGRKDLGPVGRRRRGRPLR